MKRGKTDGGGKIEADIPATAKDGTLSFKDGKEVYQLNLGGLDPVGELQMIEMLVRLNREQRITMIVSTHAVDLLPVLADRIYVLHRGRLWQEGPPPAVLADPQAAAQAGLRIPLIAQNAPRHSPRATRSVARTSAPAACSAADSECGHIAVSGSM